MAKKELSAQDLEAKEQLRSRLQYVLETYADGKQVKLARMLGKNKQSISDWMNDKKVPDGISAQKIMALSEKGWLGDLESNKHDTGIGDDRLFLRMVYPDTPQEAIVVCKRTDSSGDYALMVIADEVRYWNPDGGTPPPDHQVIGQMVPIDRSLIKRKEA